VRRAVEDLHAEIQSNDNRICAAAASSRGSAVAASGRRRRRKRRICAAVGQGRRRRSRICVVRRQRARLPKVNAPPCASAVAPATGTTQIEALEARP
jgi:hypothetical protein